MPFAGRRQSGYGIGGIPWLMREMTQEKMVVLRHADSENPVHRQCLAAAANGDINQCLAQGRNIDSVRRAVQGMAVRFTAALGVRDSTGGQTLVRRTTVVPQAAVTAIDWAYPPAGITPSIPTYN
jgi:hypothetical protein